MTKIALYPFVTIPKNSKPITSCIVFVANATDSFKVRLGGLTSESIMEAEFVATALVMQEAVLYSNMMNGLVFGTRSDSVPKCIENTSALHIGGNRTYSSEFSTWHYGTFSSGSYFKMAKSLSNVRRQSNNLLILPPSISAHKSSAISSGWSSNSAPVIETCRRANRRWCFLYIFFSCYFSRE